MDVVIIEVYTIYDEDIKMELHDIENVYGPFSEDGINDKIIKLESIRKSYNTTFQIMPLIKKIKE